MHAIFTNLGQTWPIPRAWLGQWTGPLALTAVLLVLIYGGSPNFRGSTSPNASPFAGDFLQEWLGGYLVRTGERARFYDLEYAQEVQHDERLVGFRWDEGRYLPLVYPPFYYVAVSPLSLLPVTAAAWVWAALMVSCLIASAVILLTDVCRERPPWRSENRQTAPNARSRNATEGVPYRRASRFPRAALPWLLPASLLFTPLIENLTSSQKGTVCLLILSGTYALLCSKRPYWAGLVFGLLAFKPQLTLVIAAAMLLKGQWRFVWGGATTGLTLGAISLALGLDVCGQYVAFSTGATEYLHTSGYDLTKSHCLYGFFTLLCGGQATGLVKSITLLAVLAVAVVLAPALRGSFQAGTTRFAWQFSALILATLLVSPHLFTYDLTILLLPLMLLVGVAGEPGASLRAQSLIRGLAVVLLAGAGLSPALAASSGVQLSTLVMVVLLLASARALALECGSVTSLPQRLPLEIAC